MKAGYPLITVPVKERADYMAALDEWGKGNLESLTSFVDSIRRPVRRATTCTRSWSFHAGRASSHDKLKTGDEQLSLKLDCTTREQREGRQVHTPLYQPQIQALNKMWFVFATVLYSLGAQYSTGSAETPSLRRIIETHPETENQIPASLSTTLKQPTSKPHRHLIPVSLSNQKLQQPVKKQHRHVVPVSLTTHHNPVTQKRSEFGSDDSNSERELQIDLLCNLRPEWCFRPKVTLAPAAAPPTEGDGPSDPSVVTLPLTFYDFFGENQNLLSGLRLQNTTTFNDLSGRSILLVYTDFNQDYRVLQGPGLDTTFTNNLNSGDDELFEEQALDFAMPLAFDSIPTTSIDISSNGWISLRGGETFDSLPNKPSLLVFQTHAPRLAVFWQDFYPTDSPGGLFFDTGTQADGTQYALVTWYMVDDFSYGLNTFQVKLFQNGNIALTWGDMSAMEGLVGLSVGFLAPTDISEFPTRTSLSSTFYEEFVSEFDLGSRSIELVFGGFAVPYTLVEGPAFMAPSAASELSVTLGNEVFNNQALNFEMPLAFEPRLTSTIDIDTNGWIGLVGSSFTTSNDYQSVGKFLSEAPRIAAFWVDLDPVSGGGLFFDADIDCDGTPCAIVTWLSVPESGTSLQNTFQVMLKQSGNIVLTWSTMNSANGLVGLSAGRPQPTDISSLLDLL